MAAAICTSTVNPTGCAHTDVTIAWDSVNHVFHAVTDSEVAANPLGPEEKKLFIGMALRYLRSNGIPLTNFVNHVLVGTEATNVKIYSFFGPGAAIAKANIGTAYVNICPGLNGERQVIDFTGCNEFRLMLHANLVGTGAFGARVVRDSDNTVLIENANLGAAGERELDSDWQPLPAPFINAGMVYLRAQAKSTTAADDPVFRSLKLGLR